MPTDYNTLEHRRVVEYNEVMEKLISTTNLKDGAQCKVIAGTHEGKIGTVQDIKTSKTGYITITVRQANGERFKTLGKNVQIVQ